MPSTSKKQHNFMAAIANSPSFAKKVGVPQSVGKDFNNADKGKQFLKGGDTMASKMQMFEKSGKDVEKKGMKEGSKADMAMDKKQMAMKKGGMPMKMKDGKKVPIFMAKGGFTKEANGIAQRGLTKAKQVTMKKGGKC